MVVVTRSNLVGRSAAKTAMLETIGKSNALNQTGRINYNALGQKDGIGLKSVTEKFIDSFVLAVLVPDYNVKNGKYCYCGASNKSIRELLDDAGLNNCVVKAICCRKVQPTPTDFMLKSIPFMDQTKTADCYYIQEYKVATPNLDYKAVMEFVRAEEYKSIGMILKDFDVTMDFAGSFDKDEVIEYLVKEHDFRMQGDENTLSPRTILDNDRYVGRNCLTYMKEIGGFVTRQKIYNKLVQSLESQSVRSVVGCHWRDWVAQQETRLAAARDKSSYRGLTRAEVTIYIDNTCQIPSEKFIEETLRKIIEFIPSELVYSTPYSKTWEAYCDRFIHSLVCIDRKQNIGLLVYSYNEITGKLSGQLINEFESKWKWVLENLTLNGNLPVDVIDINTWSTTINKPKKMDFIVEVTGSRYFKAYPNKSASFKTRLVSHKGCFSYTPGLKEDMESLLEKAGFLPHGNCIPLLANTAANSKSKTSAELCKVENLVIKLSDECLSRANQDKPKCYRQDSEDRLLNEALKIEEIRKPHLLNLKASEEKLEQIKCCIESASTSDMTHLRLIDQGTYPVLSAKKFNHSEFGLRYKLLLLIDDDFKTSVWSNWGIATSLNDFLSTETGKDCYDEASGYLLLLDQPLGHLTIKGKMMNQYRHYTVFCDFVPNIAKKSSSLTVARAEAVKLQNEMREELCNTNIYDSSTVPVFVKPREELLSYRENPELSSLSVGVIKRIEAIAWIAWNGKDKLLVQVDGVMYQAGLDLETNVNEITGNSYVRIDKHRFNRNTRRKFALCTIIQAGQWHKLIDYARAPLLKVQDGSTCVLDVQSVEVKGQKRKVILTDKGEVYKLKKSKLEESIKPGFI